MNALSIFAAIQALDAARIALRLNDQRMSVQMRVADDCWRSAEQLRAGLRQECPDINLVNERTAPTPGSGVDELAIRQPAPPATEGREG